MSVQRMGLDALEAGKAGIVLRLELPQTHTLRLEELGFLPGTQVRCLFCAPHGSPAAYEVGGAVFALRKQDAARMIVEAEV